jgi:hypothetical protein
MPSWAGKAVVGADGVSGMEIELSFDGKPLARIPVTGDRLDGAHAWLADRVMLDGGR